MSFCERTVPLFLYLVVSYLVSMTIHLRKASVPMDASEEDKNIAKVMFEPVSPWLYPALFVAGSAIPFFQGGLTIVTIAIGAGLTAIVWVLLSLVHLIGVSYGDAQRKPAAPRAAVKPSVKAPMLMLEDHSKR